MPALTTENVAYLTCLDPACEETYEINTTGVTCNTYHGLSDVTYDWNRVPVPGSLKEFEARWSSRRNPLDYSGVWRFRELLPFAEESQIVTIGEGQTMLRQSAELSRYAGLNDSALSLQYEGLNPSGSFKDNGMTAASTHANIMGAKYAACASTGNTSASLAIYAAVTKQFEVVVFVGSGKISYGKLSQALDYGSKTIQILGDFDDALLRVREVCQERGVYLCNSINPFRLEGQKAIMYRVLEGLQWDVPDWIVVPGGNLGNCSAFGKAFQELQMLGLIDRIPRLAVINASGADTLYRLYEEQNIRWNDGSPQLAAIDLFYEEMDAEDRRANTLATAIQINRPVNLLKALRALEICDGVVRKVTDQEILDAKAQIGAHGFGCEPASAASLAGIKLLRDQGVIAPSDRVVGILTGHQLKDPTATVAYHSADQQLFEETLGSQGVKEAPFANHPVVVSNDLDAILKLIEG